MTDRWPALMKRETAAAYCDMSPEQFDRQCFVAPIDQGWRGLRWKRSKLDAWIDALPEKPRDRKNGIDSHAPSPANDERVGANVGGVALEQPALTPEERRRNIVSRF